MSYSVITDRQVEFIQKQIQLESFHRTRAYSYFKANGLIESIGPGLREAVDYIMKKMKPGQISFGMEALPDSVMRLDSVSGKIALLGTVVVMNKRDLDAWKSNTSRVGRSMQGGPMGQAVAEQIQTLYDQVDKFLFYGDDMNGPLDNDPWVGAGDFTGMLNGFSEHAGGAGSDNNMQAAGDYETTCDRLIDKLKLAGWDSDQYVIFSDTKTWQGAANGNQYFSSGLKERDAVIERQDIASWQSSVNARDNAGTAYRMCITSPDSGKGAKSRSKRTKPYKVYQSYPFSVFPLYGGGMDRQLNYSVAIIWAGRLQELHATGLYRTASLTL